MNGVIVIEKELSLSKHKKSQYVNSLLAPYRIAQYGCRKAKLRKYMNDINEILFLHE